MRHLLFRLLRQRDERPPPDGDGMTAQRRRHIHALISAERAMRSIEELRESFRLADERLKR